PPPAATAIQQNPTPPGAAAPHQPAPAETGQAAATPPAQAQTPPGAAAPHTEEFTKAVIFGKKFYDLHDYASAYDQFAKADALQPDTPAVLDNQAAALAKAGRYSEAQAKVDRYPQLLPGANEGPTGQKLHLAREVQRELQKERQA